VIARNPAWQEASTMEPAPQDHAMRRSTTTTCSCMNGG
jgi:hypothetical protein